MKTLRLEDAVEQYLVARRALGYALKIDAGQLRSFAQFADTVGHHGPVTIDLAVHWATLPGKRVRSFPQRRLAVLRPFVSYLAAIDGLSEVPPHQLLGPSRRRPLHHIYTAQQIAALLQEMAGLRPTGGSRPRTYVTLFGLLAATGVRIAEALHLDRKDADLRRGVLTVRETKFRKTRIVPLHSTTADALRIYARARDSNCPHPSSSTFFINDAGRALCYSTVCNVFQRARATLGWSEFTPRPRIHDIRHTFACERLRRWYAEGRDATAKVAALATYLGHAHVTDTYWYLTGTPDLLALAASRFEAHLTVDGAEGELS